MEASNDFEIVAGCIIHKMNVKVGTDDALEKVSSDLSDAAYVFHYQLGHVARHAQILNASINQELPLVQVKLDILLASHDVVNYKLDKLNDKLDAQAKLFTQGFKLVVQCLALVLFMQILCYMQNSRHLQLPRETPGWASRFEDRSDLGIMWDGFVCFCDLVFLMPGDE